MMGRGRRSKTITEKKVFLYFQLLCVLGKTIGLSVWFLCGLVVWRKRALSREVKDALERDIIVLIKLQLAGTSFG